MYQYYSIISGKWIDFIIEPSEKELIVIRKIGYKIRIKP